MINKSFRATPQDEKEGLLERGVVRVQGPASLSNMGPGFDSLGLCISGFGDTVEMRIRSTPGVRINSISDDGNLIPVDPASNTASVAAQWVFDRCGTDMGASLDIHKGIPFGSGIGGSAASAVAGAWAANLLLGEPLQKEELVDAVLAGEYIASQGRHGDNVLPALLGGLVLVSSSDPTRYQKIELPRPLTLALLLPRVQILTHEARTMLPANVGLRDAVHNASELAFLIASAYRGDWEAFGHAIMQDRLVEPVRASLVPCYEAVRRAAVEAGAYGCALTGSGPAMFAVTETESVAVDVLGAMIYASVEAGIEATGSVVEANPHGVVAL